MKVNDRHAKRHAAKRHMHEFTGLIESFERVILWNIIESKDEDLQSDTWKHIVDQIEHEARRNFFFVLYFLLILSVVNQ